MGAPSLGPILRSPAGPGHKVGEGHGVIEAYWAALGDAPEADDEQ